MTTAARVRGGLSSVASELEALLASLTIKIRRVASGIILVAPVYYYEEPDPEQRATQLALKREYDALLELAYVFLRGAPDDLTRQLKDADKGFREWLDIGGYNYVLSLNRDRNREAMHACVTQLDAALQVLDHTGVKGIVLVPDTNSLLAMADPTQYRSIGGPEFRFILLPTVLAELDALKIEHRNPEVRDKAKGVIRRVRGWRDQGSLRKGVTVDGTILVQALHAEPDMDATLSWLDPNVKDDRIIASVLELEAQHPAAHLILVTGDINLQNKADAALIEASRFPE